MGLFNRKKTEMRADTVTTSFDDALLTTLLGNGKVTKEMALQVPTVSGGVTTNINNYMAYPPKWLKAYQGDNLFRYNADEGIDNLSVSILSTQAYWGA